MLQLIPHMYFLCTLVSVGLIPGGKLYGFLMLLNIAELLFIKVVLIYIPASSVSLALSSPTLYYVIFKIFLQETSLQSSVENPCFQYSGHGFDAWSGK